MDFTVTAISPSTCDHTTRLVPCASSISSKISLLFCFHRNLPSYLPLRREINRVATSLSVYVSDCAQHCLCRRNRYHLKDTLFKRGKLWNIVLFELQCKLLFTCQLNVGAPAERSPFTHFRESREQGIRKDETVDTLFLWGNKDLNRKANEYSCHKNHHTQSWKLHKLIGIAH